MADGDARVEVRGIRELRSGFRQVDKALPGELRQEFLQVATRVADSARSRVPKRRGKAASSIKPRASTTGAAIAFGGQAAPHYPWLDFGGSVGRGHRPGVAWSGAIRRDWQGTPVGSGRYVYPAISDHRDETAEAVDEAIARVARRAGFDERGGL